MIFVSHVVGIRIHRFYIKCSVCSAEITFRTDPKNTDYALESGATRNFEMWRENDEIAGESHEQVHGPQQAIHLIYSDDCREGAIAERRGR